MRSPATVKEKEIDEFVYDPKSGDSARTCFGRLRLVRTIVKPLAFAFFHHCGLSQKAVFFLREGLKGFSPTEEGRSESGALKSPTACRHAQKGIVTSRYLLFLSGLQYCIYKQFGQGFA